MLIVLCSAGLLLVLFNTHHIGFEDRVTQRREREAAVFFSGDAGFLGEGRSVAGVFESFGLPVYGVSSLAEFRERQSVSETAQIVNDAVRAAKRRYGADRILLVGHSFGADAVGVAVPQLAPDVRNSLTAVALIVPSQPIYLRADPTGISYRGPPDAELDPLWSVRWVPITCIKGEQETDSACPARPAPNVRVITLPGGHALHHDMSRLATALEEGLGSAAVRPVP